MDFIVTRSMYCPKCYAKGRPQKHDEFIVFGSRKQDYHAKVSARDGYRGFTPHIISISHPLKRSEDGKIEVKASCGVCEMKVEYKKQSRRFYATASRIVYLEPEDLEALIMRWVRSGYEIPHDKENFGYGL